jgi:hypothetical protein
MKILSKLFFACFLVLTLAVATTMNNMNVYAQSDRGADQSMQTKGMSQSSERQGSQGGLQSGQMAMSQSSERQGPPSGLQSGQMAMSQSSERQGPPSGLQSGQMAMSQSTPQNQTAAADWFYLEPGTYTIWINTLSWDYGWTDLCGMKWLGNDWGLTCFGTKDWYADSTGFGTASFYVSGGYYKYIDSCAQSDYDYYWNYGISYYNAYADHNSENWQYLQPLKC